MGKEVIQPSNVRFIGSDPMFLDSIKIDFETYKAKAKMGKLGELPKTAELIERISAIRKALLEFGATELEIDLSNRLPDNDQIHLLSPVQFQYETEMREGIGGVSNIPGEIIIKNRLYVGNILYAISHELVHTVSYKSIHATELKMDFVRWGYSTHQTDSKTVFHLVDEAVTEMTNYEIASNYWPNQDLLNTDNILSKVEYHFRPSVILFDEIIKKVASVKGWKYKTVWRELQKGNFLGESKGLKMIAQVFGKERMKKLADWRENSAKSAVVMAMNLANDKNELEWAEKIGVKILKGEYQINNIPIMGDIIKRV